MTAVIVGASAAGVTAAESLRREGYGGRVILIGDERHAPYDRPPLSKQFLAGVWPSERLALRTPAVFESQDIELRLGVAATGVDPGGRIVALADGDTVPYDHLVIATGLRPRRIAAAAELPGVHVIRDLDQALALRDDVEPGMRAVVVGGGVLGAEIAAALAGLGAAVTLVDPHPVPVARQLGTEVGAAVGRLHERNGVVLRMGTRVRGIGGAVATGRVGHVELDSGERLPADLVVAAIGSVPATGWLESSGLRLEDGVVCAQGCEVAPGIFAAGDVARWRSPRFGRWLRIEHRMHATDQGMAVARDIVHGTGEFDPIPYFWSDQFGTRIQVYGIVPPGARFVLDAGTLDDDRFLGLVVEDAVVVGAIAWNMPREIRAARAAIGTHV